MTTTASTLLRIELARLAKELDEIKLTAAGLVREVAGLKAENSGLRAALQVVDDAIFLSPREVPDAAPDPRPFMGRFTRAESTAIKTALGAAGKEGRP